MTVRPPKVSIAIPVYRGEAYLAETIDSVLCQSFDDFELIICDDCSDDRSLAIARSFSDSRMRILQNERNLGFGGNWNRCLAEARGEYIKILPQDDLLHRDCLRRQVGVLDDDHLAEVALVFCDRSIIGPSGRVLMTRRFASTGARLAGNEIARRMARLGTNPIGEPGAVLFRRSAAVSAGPFNGARPFVIDIDYWLRLLTFGSAGCIPEVLASFRLSRSSQSVRMARAQAAEFSAFLADLHRSGSHHLNLFDVKMGGLMAAANSVGRSVFYRLAIKERS